MSDRCLSTANQFGLLALLQLLITSVSELPKKGIDKKIVIFLPFVQKPHGRICTKFGTAVGAANVITCTKCFCDWLRGVVSVGGFK